MKEVKGYLWLTVVLLVLLILGVHAAYLFDLEIRLIDASGPITFLLGGVIGTIGWCIRKIGKQD